MAGEPECILAGDIGGTHARFAILERCDATHWRLHDRFDVQDQDASFAQTLERYLERIRARGPPPTVVLAVAGPVSRGAVSLTNRNWQISETDLRARGFAEVHLINDFAALAYAADRLNPEDLRCIGPEMRIAPEGTITILGAGTGFGVSCLARDHGRAIPMATEGGHIGFAPEGAEEEALLSVLARRFGRVSVERILSGPGLENLSRALDELAGRPIRALSAAEIVDNALGRDPHCHSTVERFCAIFGAVAGDMALAHGARGGVLISGGIAGRIESLLNKGLFRSRFEAKGRLSPFVRSIPTQLIVNADAALLGAARVVEEAHR